MCVSASTPIVIGGVQTRRSGGGGGGSGGNFELSAPVRRFGRPGTGGRYEFRLSGGSDSISTSGGFRSTPGNQKDQFATETQRHGDGSASKMLLSSLCLCVF